MSELMLKSVYDLLDKNYFIPSYQRGYRWEKRQIQDLLEDLYNFACDKDKTDGSFYLVNKYGLPDPDIFIFGDSKIVAEDCVRQITLFELLSEELPKAA